MRRANGRTEHALTAIISVLHVINTEQMTGLDRIHRLCNFALLY